MWGRSKWRRSRGRGCHRYWVLQESDEVRTEEPCLIVSIDCMVEVALDIVVRGVLRCEFVGSYGHRGVLGYIRCSGRCCQEGRAVFSCGIWI